MPQPHADTLTVFAHVDVLDAAAGSVLKDHFVLVEGAEIDAMGHQEAPGVFGVRVASNCARSVSVMRFMIATP